MALHFRLSIVVSTLGLNPSPSSSVGQFLRSLCASLRCPDFAFKLGTQLRILASEDVSIAFKMEPMLRAIESVEMSSGKGVVASFDHGQPCPEFILEVVLPIEKEEVVEVACAHGVVKSEPCKDLKPEAVVVPVEEECDQKVVNAEPCQVLKPDQAAVVTIEIVANDVYLTVEDCSGELQKLSNGSGSGDGDGGGGGDAATDANYSKTNGASQAKINPEINTPGDEIIIDRGLPPSSPPSESPPPQEPAWGDVPDEPVAVPDPPRFLKRPRPVAENVEVDEVVQMMRNILMDLRNADDARLSPEDEEKVRSLLVYHPKAEEKTGSGIDHIKIKRHSTFTDVRCFWVVRTDGTETDFSYHKCLKEKVAKHHPSFVDRYDAIYRAPKRPRLA